MSERGIRVAEIHFVEEGDGSEAGDEEEEDSEGEEPAAKGSRRGAAGQKTKAAPKAAESQRDKGLGGKKVVPPEATVKLNGSALRPTLNPQQTNTADLKPPKQWQSELTTGPSTLEVRAGDAGEIWKVYLDRQGS